MTVIEKPAPGGEPDQVVELRVHGVGGATPEGLLAHKDSGKYRPPYRIAGDDITGFFRGTWDEGKRGRVLEGYVWGGLTSKKVSRALWLLLFPFALANVAGWMIEPHDGDPAHPSNPAVKPDTKKVRKLAHAQMAMVRLFCAGITALVMAWFGALLVDLVAFQCGGQVSCTDGRIWMTPFAAYSIAAYPARRLALGSLLLLVMIAVLAWLSFRSQNRYEVRTFNAAKRSKAEKPGRSDGAADLSMGRDGAGLADPDFWESGELVRRLTYLHVGLAISVVAALHALALDALDSRNGFTVGGWSVGAIVVAAAFLAAATAAPWLGNEKWPGWVMKLLIIVPVAGTAILYWQGWSDQTESVTTPPGIETVYGRAPIYIALGLLCVVLLVLAVRFLSWWNRPLKPPWAATTATMLWLGAFLLAVFWHRIWGIRRIDTRLAVAVAGLAIATVAWLMARGPGWRAVIALILVAATATMWVGGGDDHGVFWALVAVAVLAAASSLWHARGAPQVTLLLGLGAAAIGIVLIDIKSNLAVQWVGLAVLGVALLPTLGADLGRKDRWRWGGPVTPVGLSLVITIALTAGSIVALGDFLDRDVDETAALPLQIDFLSVYRLLALLLVGAAVLTVLAVVIHVARIRLDVWGRHRKAIGDPYRENEKKQPDDHVDCLENVVEAAVGGRTVGSAARDMDIFLTTLATFALAGIVLTTARVGLNADSWSDFVARIEQPFTSENWTPLVGWAVYALAALPVAAIGWVQSARSDEASRKSIGILWDVLTFWPRRFHPLAPPSYAERAVPELATRVRELSHDGSKVMIVAHSQGSVIAAATVALLHGSNTLEWRRVYLVTHGCPLGRLYRRAFPGYWGGGILRFLRTEMGWGNDGGWLNLHRLTDPIGDSIFTADDEQIAVGDGPEAPAGDRLLEDPATRWRFELDACPGAAGHSNYLLQRQAVDLLDAVAKMLQSKAKGEQVVDVDVGPAKVRVVYATEKKDAEAISEMSNSIEKQVQDAFEPTVGGEQDAAQMASPYARERYEEAESVRAGIDVSDTSAIVKQLTVLTQSEQAGEQPDVPDQDVDEPGTTDPEAG